VKPLAYLIHLLCHRNPDGSFATRACREGNLMLMAQQLERAGYKHLTPQGIRSKHVDALMARWSADGLSVGTIKNRLSSLRWLCEKTGKRNLIPRDNASLGVSKRVSVSNIDKSKSLADFDAAAIRSQHVTASLALQQAFGLRREEAIKIRPALADQGDRLHLFASWCKGGRKRDVPIRTDEQRQALATAKVLAGSGSLIPERLSYRQQLSIYKSECQRIGLGGAHGLRHRYAQVRFKELTGRDCPVKGGPRRRDLSPEQKLVDDAARLTISAELGHARIQVVAVYVGA
jgi:site-specific recombinase XerC